ncbi:hypothetical protein Bbelb_334150 [Branchiostoma belcheri]|nr:hypothetical protein Bbelb_334150 [Branchiostoma belcheri]
MRLISWDVEERQKGSRSHHEQALEPKTSSSIIIMAGYLQQIEDQIFSLNEGFRGRFPDTVHFLPLTVQQLTDILEQKIKLSGYTISDYSREDMETAIGNIPIEVRSRHNARLVNQLIVNANTGQDETTLTRPNTLLTHADNVLLKRGAEGHLAVKLIDFGSACYECYPHLPRHIMRHDTLLNQITKYIQHTSKEDEMEGITTMEKTEDGWEAFRRDMAILSFFEGFFDDPLRGGVARIMYDAYVILMNQESPSLPLNCKELTSEGVGVTKQHANLLPMMKTTFGQPTPSLQLHHKGYHHLESETNSRKGKRASTQATASLFSEAKGYGQQEDAHEFLTDTTCCSTPKLQRPREAEFLDMLTLRRLNASWTDRLALAVSQAGESVSYFRNFKPNLGELFRFYDYSACRMARFLPI